MRKKRNPRNAKYLAPLSVLLILVVFGYFFSSPTPMMKVGPESIATELETAMSSPPVSYEEKVKPILERRCVVCHGCYDAPCQLKLSSNEGLQRGASDELIYNPARISTMKPTRLFVDATTTEQWRSKGFNSVLNEATQNAENNLKKSVLYHLLRLKQQHPQPETNQLPDNFTLGLNREQSCPTIDTIAKFTNKHPQWGMPYAMPNLAPEEYRSLVSWLARGALAPAPPGRSSLLIPQIDKWETFLNKPSNKQQLVSRYIFEHLFHAHIHFAGSPEREFYRLFRSSTPPGQKIKVIPTVRPYDDPGKEPFFYRLKRVVPSIVVKNHIVYEFSDQRMQRYRELFLQPDYAVADLPSYDSNIASNPFKSFAAIPIKSRYRFLLDDARFFIEGFIKGPVCRGQIALNVIEDRFWVMFFDPDQDVFTNEAQFISEIADDLQIPSDQPDSLDLLDIWTDYWKRQRRYMDTKQEWFKNIGTHDLQHAMNYIWDGDRVNPNSALTVFRHFDSGSVAYGLVGDEPQTSWILDYPLFERIHYLLVAGYSVYGNLVHQLNTRIYMDFLRMEGEDNFLVFLPADKRKAIRDSWYVGQRSSIEKLFAGPQKWMDIEAVRGYLSDNPQHELYQNIKERHAQLSSQANSLNHCSQSECTTENISRPSLERAMDDIAKLQGKNLHAFPDIAFIRIKTGDPQKDIAYTFIRNKAYKNVTSFLADERERDRSDIDRDTLTVVKWLEGSYPNFFFSVDLSDMDNFTRLCASIRNHNDYDKFVDRYGIRRTSPEFWEMADWFQDEFRRNKPVSSGLFDLNRYQNR